MPNTQIIGRVELPDGTTPANAYVRFIMSGFDTDAPDSATIIPRPIEAPIDASGNIDVELWPNQDGVRLTYYRASVVVRNPHANDDPYKLDVLAVPSSGGPYDLNVLLAESPPEGVDVDQYIASLAASVASAESAADRAEAAAELVGGVSYGTRFTITITDTNGGRGPYPLPNGVSSPEQLTVHLNKLTLQPIQDYTVVENGGSYEILFNQDVFVGSDVWGQAAATVPYDPNLQNVSDFETAADYNSRGVTLPDGRTVVIGGVLYTYKAGATDIPDLAGLEYSNVIPEDQDFTEDEGGVFDTGFIPPYSLTMFGGDVAGYIAFLKTVPSATREPFTGSVRVPADAATMQDVVDALGQTVSGDDISISIDAGHSPSTGVSVINGDYSGYTVTSVDASVTVGAFTGDFIRAENARAPVLGCKVVASGHINLVLTGAVTVVTGETLTQATSGANGVVVAGGTLSTVVLSDLDGGAFNNADELTGSTSGALGANSIPSDLTAVSIVNGYAMYGPSTGLVLPACGVDYCYDTGLVAYEGAKVKAEEAVFNFAARASDVLFSSQKPVFKSAAHAWGAGSSIYGEKLQGNDSGFYGLQASHGGTATYRNSDSQRCWRHGIRGSDGAIIDAEAANPSNSGRDGNGSCVRAFESAIINAPNINASGSGASAVRVTGGGVFNGPSGTYTGTTAQTVWAENGGRALLQGGSFDATATFTVGDAAEVNVFEGAGITTPTLALSSGGKFTSVSGDISLSSPHDFASGITFGAAGTALDRFEEGTFLPTLIAATTDFDSVTYASQEGTYQRVGNKVTVSGGMRTSALTKGAAAGSVAIGNLPFDVANGALNRGAGVIGASFNFAGQHPNACYLRDNDNYAVLGRTEATGFVGTTVADVSDAGSNRNWIMFQITYFTDEA